MKKFVLIFVCMAFLLGGANLVLAQENSDFNYEFDYGVGTEYNTSTLNEEEAAALASGILGLGIFGIIIAIVFGLVALFFFIFWIIMLIDCIRRDFDNRGVWLAALIITFFIGWSWLAAILYYFLVKRKDLGNTGGSKGGQTPPSAGSTSSEASLSEKPAVPEASERPTPPETPES